MNDISNKECYNIVLKNINSIFYTQKFLEKEKNSIFFATDYLRYFMTKNYSELEL